YDLPMTTRCAKPCLAAGLALLIWPLALGAETAEERGDRSFRQRGTGFKTGGVPDPEPIAAAVAAYEEAVGNDPDNLLLIFKLLQALYFQGYHVADDKKLQREIYQRLVDQTTRALKLVTDRTGQTEGFDELPLERQAELVSAVPGAAEAHFWAATSWGLWGMTHNPIKALRHGVGSKVRDHSSLHTLIDEPHRDAAGLRMLGRMHTEAPKVPFVTGWVDRKQGLAMLRRAVEISRRDPRNLLFLAEGILEYEPKNRRDAIDLLCEIAAREPDPEELVEHSESLEMARVQLDELNETDC
ncbi:MAG: hypothetical protein AAF657_36395, partial [Acidobacteriota bacterium]